MASQSSQGSKLSSQEQSALISDIVLYILSQDHTKYPIKRQDIVKNVLKTHGRHYKHIMNEAAHVLTEIFGMKLVEIEHSSNMKQYILVNNEQFLRDVSDLKWPEEVEAQQVLLMLLLSLIFMSGGVVKEEVMSSFLTRLGIMNGRKSHEYFGDVWKLLTVEFVRQMYVEYVRIPESNPPKYEFRWGHRAKGEVSRRELLNFVSLVYGCDPKNWVTQYQEVLQAESEKEKKREEDGK
ncbi:hypothetical protein B7P43_G02878 [Cryptotermes secundus]|uniref:MAGE domain-containing protein n=1 Tax=Cryptotermes secundus TaxID=105785 RepID=A0A2J7QG45_9NEOP|nr:non-structural maintenance of chromosomes element 3 homolog [Cryptotermes secundus]XP_023713667.1 non-structural maintenance of chromosomes element 3 homolog [Cryptotermes secundus]XP_023713668.1 non-structural maintenance of chromosomes element 3 homolog [Cryptotermes secundus]XP_023713669.1 non-structural maintenance of chromosomes element 3 homolog [Cryptotermes secundus]PNF27536.1 hypothetical protein B7P43_G02878 [Cryptotermes secundus]PNF27537.1 hypothetical protein B7P43_G02878 [Cryp